MPTPTATCSRTLLTGQRSIQGVSRQRGQGVVTAASSAAGLPPLDVNMYLLLFPYLEQQNIYNKALTGKYPPSGHSSYQLSTGGAWATLVIKLFLCPSDSSSRNGIADVFAASSYVYNLAPFATAQTTPQTTI